MSSVDVFRSDFAEDAASETFARASAAVVSASEFWRRLSSLSDGGGGSATFAFGDEAERPATARAELVLSVFPNGRGRASIAIMIEVPPHLNVSRRFGKTKHAEHPHEVLQDISRALPQLAWKRVHGAWEPWSPSDHDRPLLSEVCFDSAPLGDAPVLPQPGAADVESDGLLAALARIMSLANIVAHASDDLREPLLAAAFSSARRLPADCRANPVLPPYDSQEDAFERPTFDALLDGVRVAENVIAPPRGWPYGPSVRVRYFERLPGRHGFLLRSRALAMLYPFIPPGQRLEYLSEIAQALAEVRSSDVGRAIGLLAVSSRLSRANLDEAQVHAYVSPAERDRRVAPLAPLLIAAIVAVEDLPLRARIAHAAASISATSLRSEAIALGTAALQALSASDLDSEARNVELAWLYRQYALLPSIGVDATRDPMPEVTDPAERERLFEKALEAARRVSDAALGGTLLVCLSQDAWRLGSRLGRSRDLILEAIAILDGVGRGNGSDFMEGYGKIRAAGEPPFALDADYPSPGPMLQGARHTLADALHSWAGQKLNAWIASTFPDVWPSLPPIRFPE